MAGIITIIGAALQLLIKLFDIWRERDQEKKKLKKEALNEVAKGIETRDASKITSGFDRFRNI